MAADPNAFNRWEAGQTLASRLVETIAGAIETGSAPKPDRALSGYVKALKATLNDPDFENGFKALTLTTPSDTTIIQSRKKSDPLAVALAGDWLRRAITDHLGKELLETYHALKDEGPFSPDATSAGRRALKNRALALLGSGLHPQAAPLALSQFNTRN